MITKSPWGVLGFSVAWGRGDGFNPVETCLAASWICSQMCCHDEKNFTRFLIQCFIQFHFFFSLNINNDSVLISMVLYGCLKRLSTYSIIAIHSFQHVFFAQFFPNASSCWSPTRLPRNWPHSGMQRYRALKSARLTMLWPTWGGEIEKNPIGPSSRQRNVNSFGFTAWKPWQNLKKRQRNVTRHWAGIAVVLMVYRNSPIFFSRLSLLPGATAFQSMLALQRRRAQL